MTANVFENQRVMFAIFLYDRYDCGNSRKHLFNFGCYDMVTMAVFLEENYIIHTLSMKMGYR